MDKIQALKVFIAVANSKSFSIAADRLDLSAPMVSRYIAWLEQSIGARLLNRTTRRLSLTEAGSDYLRRTSQIIDALEEADTTVAQGEDVRGTLRITTASSFGQNQLMPIIVDFLKQHPQVTIELNLENRRINIIDEGYDLAIRITHEIELGLIAKKLCVCRTVICAAPYYLKQYGVPKTLEELTQHQCLLFPGFQRQTWQFHDKHNHIKNVEVQGRLQINNIDALMQACIAGLGLAHFPTFLASPMIKAEKIAIVTLANYTFLSPNIYVVYPSRQYLPSKVRAFINALSKWVDPEPVWDRGLS